MKRITLLAMLLLFVSSIMAQDDNYTGPAKTQVRSFWAQIEKLKTGNAVGSTISNAERMIQMIKEKDPGYNTAALEAEVKPWKDKATKEKGEANAATQKADDSNAFFNEFWRKLIGVYSKGGSREPGVTGETYYNRVKELNLVEFEERKKQLGEIKPNSFVAKIVEQLADYDDYVVRAERLKWNVTVPMTESRNAANPQKKIDLLTQAKFECEAVLLMSPNNEPFKKKLAEINKLMGNAEGESAKFFTSDFHKEHLNKIVWSSKQLVIGKENEMASSIKTEFKTGEAIFGTAYLGIDAKDAMNNNSKLRVRIQVDGGTAVWGGDLSYIDFPLSVQGKSYIQFALLPDAQWLSTNYAPYLKNENWTISYFLDDLVRGGDISHEITYELIFPTSKISNIESKLTLDLNDGITEIKKLATKLSGELMASRQLPKAGMSNASLESQMLTAANKLGWNSTYTKAVITSSGWTVRKNQVTGAIVNRTIGAVCATKDPDGKCYLQEFSFSQDYTGGGNYSGTVKYSSYGGKREIGCDKVK